MKLFLFTLILFSNDSSLVVRNVDSSNWESSGVGVLWLTCSNEVFKVIVFKDNFENGELPDSGETVNWELQNFSMPSNSKTEEGDSIKWHPGVNWPRCWTNLELIICPDTDSSFLYLLKEER